MSLVECIAITILLITYVMIVYRSMAYPTTRELEHRASRLAERVRDLEGDNLILLKHCSSLGARLQRVEQHLAQEAPHLGPYR